MRRRTSIFATAAAVLITAFGAVPAHATTPTIDSITASPSTIYPLVNNAKRPGSTTITISGDATTIDHLEIRNTSAVSVLNLPGGQNTYSWNGRATAGAVVPAGSYTVVAIGAGSEVATPSATITVSTKKLIHKTFTRTVTAAGSMFAKIVGKCSTLRKPSKRGWKGSLGLYSNTRCKTQTFKASLVSTAHVLRLPSAEQYLNLRVNTYGGAAKAKKHSRGVIRYLQVSGGAPVSTTFLSSKVGNHTGPLRSTQGLVDGQRFIAWNFVTAYKAQYDVKNFTVVVHYDVLG
jgi:hypothetical protein